MRAAVFEDVPAIFFRVLRLADLQGHLHDFLSRAAVGGPLEDADSGDHRRMKVGDGRGGYARSEGGGVGAVFRVEDEVDVEQVGGLLVGDLSKQHVEEVPGVVEVRVGGHRFQSLAQAVVRRHDGRPHGRKPDALADGGLHRVILHFVVEGRKRG